MPSLARRALCALALSSTSLSAAPSALAEEHPPLTANRDGVLDRAALIRAVLARNAGAVAAEAALRAADARAEAAGSFADPALSYQLAPRSLWDGPRSGHRVELAQPLGTFGKRGLARSAARAEADGARFALAAVRLDLALAASQLYHDLYLAGRSLAVNAAHRGLVEDLRAAALARYEAGQATKQAPLAAELEAARLEHREVELTAAQRIAVAQLNALLRRAPDAQLPPPPASLAEPPAPELLGAEAATAARPELRAAEARAAARDAEVRLVQRERFPDLTLMAGYDGMWDEPAMRPMLGFELELPLQRARRRAAIAEAEALRDEAALGRERAEIEANLAAAVARERLAEARHALVITREQILPAARDQAESANAALAAGRSEFGAADFGAAIDAERDWFEAELAAEEALVTAWRRTAELQRALGLGAEEEKR